MDRVGGYLHFKALELDARAYDDVLIAMSGEAEAQKMAEIERKLQAAGNVGR